MKTLADAAKEFGVTKTTISRALSGKGRVGKEMRQKILEWAAENNYTPNSIAKSLVERKTHNIAVVLPKNADNIFFQQCLIGIAETIAKEGYDTITAIDYGDDISSIERIVKNQKVDGIILTRTLEKDKILKYVKGTELPYLVIGSVKDNDIFQVDVDQRLASCDLTRQIIQSGITKIALLAGGKDYPVNRERVSGFEDAFKKENISLDNAKIFWDVWTDSDIHAEKILREIAESDVECIATTDNAIIQHVLNVLHIKKIKFKKNITLISFYEVKDDISLNDNDYPVSTVCIDSFELSHTAADNMLLLLKGNEIPNKTVVPYTLKIRKREDQ